MRNVIFLIHLSLDGFVAGPKGEMDWIVYNDELEQYSHDLHAIDRCRHLWPRDLPDDGRLLADGAGGPEADAGAMAHAQWVDQATKIVFSRTLDRLDWHNSVLIHDHVAEEITRLKQQPGKDMWLLGSPTLAQTFMQLDLIDEYRHQRQSGRAGQRQASVRQCGQADESATGRVADL